MQQDQQLVLVEPHVQRAHQYLHGEQRRERPGVAGQHPAPHGHHDKARDQQRRDVHERAVGEVDVHQLRLPERHELAVAGGELLAAGVVGAVAELVVGAAVVLRAGHVAAGHDRAEHRHGAAIASTRIRGPPGVVVAPLTPRYRYRSPPSSSIARPRCAATYASSRFSSTVAPPSAPWATTSSSSPAAGARYSRCRRHARTKIARIMQPTTRRGPGACTRRSS